MDRRGAKITEKHIRAYKNYVAKELGLIEKYSGKEAAFKNAPYLMKMYLHIAEHPEEYRVYDDGPGVTYYELEFVESVWTIRIKLMELAEKNDIPQEVLFIPRISIEGRYGQIINLRVIKIIRELFDKDEDDDFRKLRQYKAFHRSSKIAVWTEHSDEAVKLYTDLNKKFKVSKKDLIKKRLNLFDEEFARQQMMWMSEYIWIHNWVVEAYKNQNQ
ncbi:MAG: hypothetical protein H3C39_10015 [Flavobacteriia bacterium]|nr:hypothetical protein [Flavobacteriia bacterium]